MHKYPFKAFIFAILLLHAFLSQAQPCTDWQITSPFNSRIISDSLPKAFTFLVSGHFHGASTNVSGFPASSLQANIDSLNHIQPAFMVSLGDLFLDVDSTIIHNYRSSLFNKLQFPLFNAVGNHDLANGNIYEKFYGRTYSSFVLSNALFIILNTELNDGSIKGEQLEFLTQILNISKEIKYVFLFSHRPIWSEENSKYDNLFADNTHSNFGNNFKSDVLPLLIEKKKTTQIIWFSGSLGGLAPTSFFYDNDDGITFIQTAIRDLPRDAVLQVSVGDSVSFKGISLTGKKLEKIQNYNIQYWQQHNAPPPQFSFRMLPYYCKMMLLHRYYWYGILSIIGLYFFFLIISKWRKRK